jgi:hypothetical protein
MKSPIKLYEAFLNENTATVSREAVIKDVDAIITSLETLVSQVAEEIEEDFNQPEAIEEADDNILVQFITSMKAVKAQKKVNNLKVQKVSLEIARDEAPNADQKEKFKTKEATIKGQIDALQKAVDDRFAGKGGLVAKKLANAKIEGQLAVLKAHGADANADQGDLKSQMADLQAKYKENQEALKELEPSAEDKEEAFKDKARQLKAQADDEKDPVKKAQLNVQAAQIEVQGAQASGESKEVDKAKDNLDKKVADLKKAQEKAAEDAEKAKNAPKEDDPAADDADKPEADKPEADKPEADKPEADKPEAKPEDKPEEDENDPKKPKKESLSYRASLVGATQLVERINSLETWQIENTELGSLLEMEVSKLEMDRTLNENRYFMNSVKDRFSKLI